MNLAERIGELLRKPGELLEFAEKYEAAEVLKNVTSQIKYVIHHYGPRSISGYLHFGTGDPASAGQLTGVLYLILPARADRFEVRPEFNEPVLETEMICSGHIRMCHLLRAGWQLFFDKKLRRLIKISKNERGSRNG